MPQNDTLILRAALEHDKSIYRDIEIEGSKSLYKLAEAIIDSYGFDFDHAFGFYDVAKPEQIYGTKKRKYELFADLGEADPGVLGVKKTKIGQAFPEVGHKLIFLFDYGDEWLFRVSVKEQGTKQPKTRYPRVVASKGEAPEQCPDPDDCDEEEVATWGFNPRTGEKIYFAK
jgi:hypothetical protein